MKRIGGDKGERRSIYTYNAGKEHTIPCNMINCFCMFSDYIPLTLDDWIRLDKRRREELITNQVHRIHVNIRKSDGNADPSSD